MTRRQFAPFLVAILLAFVCTSCAGSTQFLGDDFPSVTLAPGSSDTVTLQLEAIGSHSGRYEITAVVSSGEGFTAAVVPTSAEVDGILDVEVTITADDTAEPGNGSVFVDARNDDADVGSGTTVNVTIVGP